MRKYQFDVPAERITEFVEQLVNLDLDNTITGITEDNEIVIEVDYEKQDEEAIDGLELLVERIREELEEEEEED